MKEADQVSLVVDLSSLTKSTRGSIYGTIYLNYRVGVFPAPGWTDLVVPVSLAWLDSVYSLTTGKAKQREVHFMDGPFRVRAFVAQEPILRLQFIENCVAGDRVHADVNVDGASALLDALSVADLILAECRDRSWKDDDIRSLADAREYVQSGRGRN